MLDAAVSASPKIQHLSPCPSSLSMYTHPTTPRVSACLPAQPQTSKGHVKNMGSGPKPGPTARAQAPSFACPLGCPPMFSCLAALGCLPWTSACMPSLQTSAGACAPALPISQKSAPLPKLVPTLKPLPACVLRLTHGEKQLEKRINKNDAESNTKQIKRRTEDSLIQPAKTEPNKPYPAQIVKWAKQRFMQSLLGLT